MADKQSGVVTIHGREYETVALRVKKFRDKYPDWTIKTEILEKTDEVVVLCTSIFNEAGRLISNGHSEEHRKASQINRTSALENAETSAIGRALAALGLGGTEFASAEEVANAVNQQKKSGVHKPSDGAMDRVTEDRQKIIVDTATLITDYLMEDKDFDAYALCETFEDPDEKVALWSLLNSKQRSRIKAQAEKAKVAA